MKSICFISLKSYDLVAGVPKPRYVGGAERQTALLARMLCKRGYRISVVTLDYGQEDGIEHEGVRVYKAYDVAKGLPYVRFVHPCWTGLWAAMSRAAADVYHQMGGDSETGQVALWCRVNGRKFVFATAADADCDRVLPYLQTRRQRWLYRYGLSAADSVVTQTAAQQERLRQSFGIESTVIRSCTPDPGWKPLVGKRRLAGKKLVIAWVGRFASVRRLDRFLDLAEMCPQHDFIVVGSGNERDPYVCGLLERGKLLPNLRFMGRISDAELDQVYRTTDFLVCTSSMDGVPTVFLEAWARGVPVLSLVDPDGVIADRNLGRVVKDIAEMRIAISDIVNVPGAWDACSQAARQHYEMYHMEKTVADAYEQLF